MSSTRTVQILEQIAAYLSDEIKETGGCEHDVGVCSCRTQELAMHVEDLLADLRSDPCDSPYYWIILKDHIADEKEPPGGHLNAVGLEGPRNGNRLLRTNPRLFKMFDDDGDLYYEGVIFGEYEGDEPLIDFGRPNAGCTRINIGDDSFRNA